MQDSRSAGAQQTASAPTARRRFIVTELADEEVAAPEIGTLAELLRQLDEAHRTIEHLLVLAGERPTL